METINPIKLRHSEIEQIASTLHQWSCHSDEHLFCDWIIRDKTLGVRDPDTTPYHHTHKYFEKAERLHNVCGDAKKAHEFLMSLRAINPKMLFTVIKEL